MSFLKIKVLLVFIALQVSESLCDQLGGVEDVHNTDSVARFKESSDFDTKDQPSYSSDVFGERGEFFEIQDLSQYGPFQEDDSLTQSAHTRWKRSKENKKEACPSCTTPKGSKHIKEEENSANLRPTLVKNGAMNEDAIKPRVCPSCAKLPAKIADKRSDENACPTCPSSISRNEHACPTGSPLGKRGTQDEKIDVFQNMGNQKICPVCATLLEEDFAVCPTCLAASTINRLKRETRRAAHFGRHQKPLDDHSAHKRQNQDKQKYRRSPRQNHKTYVLKRGTAKDYVGNVDSLLDKDREDDLYQSFGRFQNKDDELGFVSRSRIRTHRLTDHLGEIVKVNAEDDVNKK